MTVTADEFSLASHALRDLKSLEEFRRDLIDHCSSAYFRSSLEGGLQHWTRRCESPWLLAQVARFAQQVPGCRLLDDACGVNATASLLGLWAAESPELI
jgi:hypothetical protein